jgi:alpha-beta hydrolase superfamily lysophospholipase
VSFVNPDGHRLVGILHEPIESPRSDVGVILLSPGVKNRVAPHRLYNKMAAEYVALGFWVFRFDFYGLGDSEGEIREPLLADLYGSIQVGRYVEDTRSAMDWMRRRTGVRRFVLGGLCGGAITGVLAGAGHEAVAGILSLGLPVILDGSSVDKIRNMTGHQLARMRRGYLRKLMAPSAWLRVLTLRTDFRLLARALTTRRRPAAAGAPSGPPAPAASGTNANPRFPPAFLRLLADGRPVLLLYSGADRLYAEFQEKFLKSHQERLRAHAGLVDVVVVDRANHVFTFQAWQDEMLARTRAWLLERFPGPNAQREMSVAGTMPALME